MAGIHNVIQEGRYRQFRLLMKLGSDVNYPSPEDGFVPLMRCCYIKNERYATLMTKALLDRGANKGYTDRLHRNCLVHAVVTNRVPVMKLLLELIDFDVNQVDQAGNTLLHHVAFCSGEDMARCVIARLPLNRTDVDKANNDELTPLMSACVNGNIAAAQVLVNEGNASLTVRDNKCFRNALEWLRLTMVVPNMGNPFSYDYRPKEQAKVESSTERLNLPSALKRSKTSLTSTVGVVNYRITPVLRNRSVSAPPRDEQKGSTEHLRKYDDFTSPSVHDLSDMRSAESRIRLMRNRLRYNNTQSLRQIFMKYETQLCPAYRPSATPQTYEDSTESVESFCSSSQASTDRSPSPGGKFRTAEKVVESAVLIKNKLNNRPSRLARRGSNLSKIGKQSSTDSSGTFSGSLTSSASSDKFADKMRKVNTKLSKKRAISQPALASYVSIRNATELTGSMTVLPDIKDSASSTCDL